MSIDREYAMVCDFHDKFSFPAAARPVRMTPERAAARAAWMREEIDEFLEAETLPDQADAMIDLIYFALGTLAEMGVRPAELFRIVHEANMQKLWPDGKAHYAADGKLVKSPEWRDPYPLLEAAIAAMGGEEGA